MRVAHLTTVDSSLRYLLLPQLLAVLERDGEVTGISAPGPDVEFLEKAGVRHLPLRSSTRGMNVAADLRAALDLWRILRRERFDVLHTHNPKPGLYGRVVGRLARVPIVVNTVHGFYATPDDPLAKRAVVYALEAVASRFSDGELVQNPEDVELMHARRLAPRRRIRLLGNGVDLARFDPDRFPPDRRQALRAELELPNGLVIGTVGRLVAEKGYPELFEALDQLGDGYTLLVAGSEDPTKSDALPRQMLDRAARRGVRFLGMRTDIDSLYACMDVFVLPSHREGFPRAPMEAAAMGLPVVTTDVRGCRQVVDDGVNGLLVPVHDAGALATAIRRLGDDPQLRRRMGDAGRERARYHFNEDDVVRIVMNTYEELAARKGLATKKGAA